MNTQERVALLRELDGMLNRVRDWIGTFIDVDSRVLVQIHELDHYSHELAQVCFGLGRLSGDLLAESGHIQVAGLVAKETLQLIDQLEEAFDACKHPFVSNEREFRANGDEESVWCNVCGASRENNVWLKPHLRDIIVRIVFSQNRSIPLNSEECAWLAATLRVHKRQLLEMGIIPLKETDAMLQKLHNAFPEIEITDPNAPIGIKEGPQG